MRRVLTTFGFGEHAAMLRIALPTFGEYAARHGYDLFVPAEGSGLFDAACRVRPYSWWKVEVIRSLFSVGYDAVLWLDCDVVVRRHDRDIAADCTDKPMHMVVHQTADGAVPNCGVWFVRSGAAGFLSQVWNSTSSRRESGWWEQAGVIDCLGGDSNAEKVAVPPGPMWGELPYEWNPHPWDARGVSRDCRFFHATAIQDRALSMRRLLGET